MQKTTPLEKYQEAAARRRLDTYLTDTLPVLDAGGWEAHEVCLGVASGRDRIVTGGIGYEPDSEDIGSGYWLRLTLTPGRETECVIEVPGCPQQLRRNLALGVGVPTADQALRMYLEAFGRPEEVDE